MADNLPEFWLRGPVKDIPPLLQPVAHALLQALEEVKMSAGSFSAELLWKRPANIASVGFHLQHITGVLDRLTTYALGKPLSDEQMLYLQVEGKEIGVSTEELVHGMEQKVKEVLQQLQTTDENSLTDRRTVGRKALPSTVIGLLFHAAEHTMRHVGQLLVTVRVLQKANRGEGAMD